jgi:hypothetical protein
MVFITASLKYIKIIIGIVIIAFGGIVFWNNMLKRRVNKIERIFISLSRDIRTLSNHLLIWFSLFLLTAE